MLSFWRHRLFWQTWHPSFDELVLYMEGEPGPQRGRIGAHVKSCWSCRLTLDKIDRAIAAFMDARNSSFEGAPTFPQQASQRFAAKLDRLEHESGGASLFSDAIRGCSGKGLFAQALLVRLAILFASVGLLAAIFFLLHVAQPVSAKEILSQVRQSETRTLRRVPSPVIYRKLELRRTSRGRVEMATWEIWNDTGNNRVRRRVKGVAKETGPVTLLRGTTKPPGSGTTGPLQDLEDLYKSHRADWERPLSPGNYEAWRASIPQQSEKVLEGRLPNGEKAAILKVSREGPASAEGIVAAEFTVRAADWHPVGERLVIQKPGEVVDYSLGEIAFDVMALNHVPSSIFAEPAPVPASLPYPPVLRIVPAPVPFELPLREEVVPPSAVDLMAAEVEVQYALHSVNACIGRPITVHRSAGSIEVEGVVDSEERKEDVVRALRGILHVSPNIRTVTEVEAAAPVRNSETDPAAIPRVTEESVADTQPRLASEDLLRQYFAATKCRERENRGQDTCVREEIAGLSRDALAHSERALAQVWALRRIVEWEPFVHRDELRTSTRGLVELMVRDHLNALANELERWQTRLVPILKALAPSGSLEQKVPAIEQESFVRDPVANSVLRLHSTVDLAASLTIGAFTETTRPVNEPSNAMQTLLLRLNASDEDLEKLNTEVRRAFSGFPRAAASTEASEENRPR